MKKQSDKVCSLLPEFLNRLGLIGEKLKIQWLLFAAETSPIMPVLICRLGYLVVLTNIVVVSQLDVS